jgi:diguanylate cyclase (GGDEF)-like protein
VRSRAGVKSFACHEPSARRWQSAGSARRFVQCGWGLVLLLVVNGAMAVDSQETGQLLKRAYDIKTVNHPEFVAIVKSLAQQAAQLSAGERESLRYLLGWESVYEGDYDNAIAQLQAVASGSSDAPLRFRAGVTLVNVLTLAARYEQAFSWLSWVLDHLSEALDKDARELGLLSAALLYNEVWQYDLGMSYAQKVLDEHGSDEIICKAGQLKLQALSRSGKLPASSGEFQVGIDACLKVGELLWANIIRTYQAETDIDQGRLDEAATLLSDHYDEASNARYPRLISAFDALLAEAYRAKGATVLARRYALDAVDSAAKNAYTEPLVTAYRVLYEIAKGQGDFALALAFHEKYTAADKGYLDDAGVRRLAYQKVSHESIASKLQLEALNNQNHALHLERELAGKAVETSRLYIAMLTLILAFIALWAYMTKRSQLHFRALSQLDGLTGICNRPHFIDQAEKVLQLNCDSGQEVCVILCDLDHFKAINDKYGHATGDFVLKRAVEACSAHLLEGDIFARVGGEEFAILLPGCRVDEARRRAEQLRITIAATNVQQGVSKATVSASFGVSASSRSGYELRQLMAHADAALYQAKYAGRNRVVLYDAMDEVAGLVAATSGEAIPSP